MSVMRDKNTPTSTFRVLANRVHTYAYIVLVTP